MLNPIEFYRICKKYIYANRTWTLQSDNTLRYQHSHIISPHFSEIFSNYCYERMFQAVFNTGNYSRQTSSLTGGGRVTCISLLQQRTETVTLERLLLINHYRSLL